MGTFLANRIVKVTIPALLGIVATYMATSWPVAYQMICSGGAG